MNAVPDPTSGDAADLGELVYLTYEQVGRHMELLLCVRQGSPLWKTWMEGSGVMLPPEQIDQLVSAREEMIRVHEQMMHHLRMSGQPMPRPS